MEFVISIYKGGERVDAKDCDFNSYSKLGLLCPVCKQEVYLRKGKIIKPYFAHFPATNPKQVKQCRLRVSSDENAIETSEFIGDRGQRLEIFQQRFMSMIYVGEDKIVMDVEFKNWINSIKLYNNQAINKITKDCTEYFITHQKEIVEIYCVSLEYEQPLLQQQIALEAIDYLCVQSSLHLLEYLLHYSVYKLYEHEQDELFQQEITTKDIVNTCQYAARIIMINPWIEVIDNAENTHLLTNTYQLLESKIVKNKSFPKTIGTFREPQDKDSWTLLSQRVTSTEMAIIAMNAPKYKDCVLMYRNYQLEKNQYGQLTMPAWLENTLKANKSIYPDDILGYIGIKYSSGKIDNLGIVYLHNKKDKITKVLRRQLWYMDIVKHEHQQINQITSKMVTKFVKNPKTGNFEKQNVPITGITTAITSQQVTKDPEVSIFMSLYGIRHNSPITAAKLTMLGTESKQILINWNALIGLRVAPINKDGQPSYDPKYHLPYTII